MSTENTETVESVKVDNYSYKVGLICLGGGGMRVMRQLTKQIGATEYKDFYFYGLDTDGKMVTTYPIDEEKGWTAPGRTSTKVIGLKITKGHGAGGDPNKGAQALKNSKDYKELLAFIDSMDEIIIVSTVGGGTGTGAIQVVAQACVNKGASALAIVMFPDPEDGLDDIALPALKEIEKLVPTIVVENAYIDEFLKEMEGKIEGVFHQGRMWDVINDPTARFVMALREIIQEPGDEENLDIADYRTVKGMGSRVVFGHCDLTPEKSAKASKFDQSDFEKIAEQVKTELLKLRFQNESLVKSTKGATFWYHGPWDIRLKKKLEKKVVEHLKNLGGKNLKIKIHRGSLVQTKDNKLWVAMMLATDPASVGTTPTGRESRSLPKSARRGVASAIKGEFELDLDKAMDPTGFSSTPSTQTVPHNGTTHSGRTAEFAYLKDGVERRVMLPFKLTGSFPQMMQLVNEERDVLCEEIGTVMGEVPHPKDLVGWVGPKPLRKRIFGFFGARKGQR